MNHFSVELVPNDEGWYPGRCNCGWDGGMFPSAEDACDALMDHARESVMPKYAVVGHYCPTDASPETDAEKEVTAVVVETRERGENWLSWFPNGSIVRVRP